MPCFTDDELRSIFSQIDRTTDKGRRDYAIFLLAMRTGMRACDISELKLTDISWTEKTIRVIQKKTKVSLMLPLPIDAGNAIADHILHSRPRVDNPYVFLCVLHPVSGVPVPAVAQILGHREMGSSKRYISLDTENLRECCLDIGLMRTQQVSGTV